MHRIRNFTALARTPVRRDVLDIIEAGLDAIDTSNVVRAQVRLDGDTLIIGSSRYDLRAFRRVHLLGLGKSAPQAAAALEQILGTRAICGTILGPDEATHPLPSAQNVKLSGRLVQECEEIHADDLVLVIVSGGGSAMLCWPASECEQGTRLYEAAIKRGLDITELNIVRKHISALKGGGLAAMLHPATVVGLIFSDVPGNIPEMVASGPTYPDASTVADAQAIIDRYSLGHFELQETPKDAALFATVENIVLVSNTTALEAMRTAATRFGYAAEIVASDMLDDPARIVQRLLERARPHSIMLGGGEARFAVTPDMPPSGRNQYTTRVAMSHLTTGQLFASVASDGVDNDPTAGAITDGSVVETLSTGPTGANVSDLFLLLTP